MLTQNTLPYYDFMPYLYGGCSLQAMGWLDNSGGKIRYAGRDRDGERLPFERTGASIYQNWVSFLNRRAPWLPSRII
jgi:hypothetical protein